MNIKSVFRPVYRPVMDWLRGKHKKPLRYHHLYDEIRRIQASTILEVGTWNGNRAMKMITTAQKFGENVSYIGFDLFEDLTEDMYKHELSKMPPRQSEVQKKLESTGADVTLIQGNTHHTLPEYVKQGKTVDFIFIDGGHNVETVQSDWDNVSQLMHEKTVVIFDDYWRNRPDQSAKPVVDAIDTAIYNVEILPEIDCFDNTEFGRLEISFAKVTKN